MKDFILKICIALGAGIMMSQLGVASEKLKGQAAAFQRIENQIQAQIPGSKVVILPDSRISGLSANDEISQVEIGRIVPNGLLDAFILTTDGRRLSGQIHYEARVPTPVALRRIRPGERLSSEDFQVQEVNVVQGMNFEYRGLILPRDTALDQYEAKQTILEGQYPLRTGVQRVPDIKRGDLVEVRLISGEIQLATGAQAQEPGYLNSSIRVITTRTKRELQAVVKSRGIVEVQL